VVVRVPAGHYPPHVVAHPPVTKVTVTTHVPEHVPAAHPTTKVTSHPATPTAPAAKDEKKKD
jgi:hypothetical protein